MGRILQDVALRRLLEAIAGDEPAGSFVEMRFRWPGRWQQLWFPVSELDRAARAADDLGQLGDVYVGCAPRIARSGGKDAVGRVWMLWADPDSKESSDRLRKFRPLPSIVQRSGTADHFHSFWPLSEPLTPAATKIANKRLAFRLGADCASTDIAHILRVPGSLNHKHAPPALVECVRLKPHVFTAAQIVGELDNVEQLERPATTTVRTSGTRLAAGQLDVRSIPSAQFVPLLTGHEVDSAGFVQCPFHKNGQERTPSLHVSAVESRWYCHATDCQQGGGLPEFYALLHGRGVPRGSHEFIKFVYEIKDAVSGGAA
jgi:hypothetical protein